MRNLRIALVTCLVLSPLAFGEWRIIPGVSGQAPSDLWIWDAGAFSVHTSSTAYRLEDVPGGPVGVVGPIIPVVAPAFWVGSYVDSAGCLAAVNRDGLRTDCAGNTVDLLAGASTISAFRATSRYAAYADGRVNNSFPGQFFAPVGTLATPGALGTVPVTAQATGGWLSVLSAGTSEFALVGRAFNALLMRDGAELPVFPGLSLPATGSDLSLSPDGGLRGVLTRDSSGVILSFDGVSTTSGPFAIIASPRVVNAVAFREAGGDERGRGWGLALVDGTTLYTAIPDPAAPAQTWVPSTLQPPPSQSGTWQVIRCLDSSYCVLASTGSATGTNLVSYRNAFRPAFHGAPSFVVDEGTAPELVLDAGDPDGDAVFVTWSFDAGYTSHFTIQGASADGKRLTLGVPGNQPGLCGVPSRTVALDVFLGDGLASHVESDAGTVTVVHVSAPPAPLDEKISVPAGTGTVTVPVTQPVGVCPVIHDYQLQPPQNLATAVTPLGLSAAPRTFTPPATLCSPAPVVVDLYVVRAHDGQLFSQPGTLTVEVLPWGAPLQPFAAPATARQDAGSTARYFPQATHACAPDPGFPGVTTLWSWDSGVPGATVTLTGDGGVEVATAECTAGTIALSAANRTNDDAGLVSPPGGLTVEVFTDLRPIDGLPVLLDAGASGGLITGSVDVNVNCKPLRPLTADVTLLRADGGFIAAIDGGPLGPFALPTPGACNGGEVMVEAVVRQGDGGTSAVTRSGLIPTPYQQAGVEAIAAQELTVQCGGPATVQATAVLADGGCATVEVRWSSAGPFAILPATGNPATLETASQDFGGLIGQVVNVIATADAGLGNTGGLEVPLRVTALPFITVTHRSSTPVASESRLLSVEVTLTNGSACPVGGVELRESLVGMSWLPGSVRMNGVELSAQVEPGDAGVPELVVPGLSLDGGASLTFSYSARPALLGEPAPHGRAELRQVPISRPAGLPAGADSCGCGAGGLEGPVLLGLGLLARALRRRRPRRRA